MIPWILGLVCVLLLWGGASPVMAQEVTTPISAEQLQWREQIAQQAFQATEKGDFARAEAYWTQLIELAPENPDPYLNRGVALEGQKRYQEAIADYNRVLELSPDEAMAYNNRGNAKGGQGKWQEALADYQKAAELAPDFAFARANAALALYQTGAKAEAIRTMRNLVRKYPLFPDMRAALTAVLWEEGKQGEAESNWVAAVGMDNRYQDLTWVQNSRRWPPQMAAALEKFLTLQ